MNIVQRMHLKIIWVSTNTLDEQKMVERVIDKKKTFCKISENWAMIKFSSFPFLNYKAQVAWILLSTPTSGILKPFR
jgi:hypothetical protein